MSVSRVKLEYFGVVLVTLWEGCLVFSSNSSVCWSNLDLTQNSAVNLRQLRGELTPQMFSVTAASYPLHFLINLPVLALFVKSAGLHLYFQANFLNVWQHLAQRVSITMATACKIQGFLLYGSRMNLPNVGCPLHTALWLVKVLQRILLNDS